MLKCLFQLFNKNFLGFRNVAKLFIDRAKLGKKPTHLGSGEIPIDPGIEDFILLLYMLNKQVSVGC